MSKIKSIAGNILTDLPFIIFILCIAASMFLSFTNSFPVGKTVQVKNKDGTISIHYVRPLAKKIEDYHRQRLIKAGN